MRRTYPLRDRSNPLDPHFNRAVLMKFQDSDTIIPSVLLLDDEHQIHSAVKLRLGDGYRLLSVFSPKEALALIAHEQVDLCIVDVQMAEMEIGRASCRERV